MESADPRGSGVRGNRRGLVQGVLEPKKSYPRAVSPAANVPTFCPVGPLFGVRDRVWVRVRTALGPKWKIIVFLKET